MCKVLMFTLDDLSLTKVVRVYLSNNYIRAEVDLQLLLEYGSSDRDWKLIEVELAN